MPYIAIDDKDRIDEHGCPRTPGELAYALTKICLDYETAEHTFADFATIIGVLDCVKEEYRRRRLNPYEDKKILQNGDVFI